MYKIMTNMLNKSIEKGEPDLNITFIYNMPFRGIAKMAGGMYTMEMAEGILTMVKALRQAAKNIMFTIVRSGNYTMEKDNAGLDRMTTMFIGIDALVGVAVVGIAALIFLRYRKRNQQA